MFSFNNNFVSFTLLCVLGFVRCLVELQAEDNNDIAITEAAIRETVNKLFATFRIRDVGHKPRLKDLSIIHNFFVSITLKDCDNLKKIVQLSQVYDLDNNTLHFMTKINEVLNESDKSNEATDDIYVNTLIEKFINKLRDLKKTYKFNRNFANFGINAKILEHFNNHEVTFTNITHKVENAHDFEEEIWKPTEASGRRIFQGHRTRIKHYPFMASIHFFERFQCAGSIIKQDLVITAASCLQLAWNNRFFRENPSFLSAQVGSNYYEASGEHIPALEVYFHPDYEPKTLNNNLAIMRLGTLIVFSKKHENVKRVIFDQNPSPLPVNTDGIIIVGWGARDHSNVVYGPWINRLSFAELDYYSLFDCQEVYSKEYVTKKHFCAGFFSKGSGACQNDVGGPGLSGGILVGVISFGPPTCGTPDAPTVFTKVGFYKDWINSIIKKPMPVIVKLTTLLQPKTSHAPHYSDRTTKGFKIKPVTTVHTNNIKMRLRENSLRILEDNKLFDEFMSTMFEKENKAFLDSSKDATDSGKGKTIKLVKKKVTTKVTSTTKRPLSLSDESTYEDEDSEIKEVESLSSPQPLLLQDEPTYEDEEQPKLIKQHTSSSKRIINNNSLKYKFKPKRKFTSTTLLSSSNNALYLNKDTDNRMPKMKAIEEENDITLPEETLKALDDDKLFQELLSSMLGSEEKNNFELSNNKTLRDSAESKTLKHSIRNKHSKVNKMNAKPTTIMTTTSLPDATEYEDEDEYKDGDKDEVVDENEDDDEDDTDDYKDDGKDDDKDDHKDDDRDDDKDDNKDDGKNDSKNNINGEDKDDDEDSENEYIRKHISKINAIEKSTVSAQTYNNADEGASNNDDSKLEKGITDLLDDIDVLKLLESDEVSNSGDEKKDTITDNEKNRFK